MLPDAEAEFSADEKEGYLIMESDALEDWNVKVTYRTSADDRGAMAFLKSSHGRSADL